MGGMDSMSKRFIPTRNGIGKMPYFMMRVVDMKAWQLYVGQSLFLVVMGILFWLLNSVLASLGVDNRYLKSGVSAVRSVATGGVTADSGVDVLKTLG